MTKQNQIPVYPKVSQEQVLSVAQIITSALQDPTYLTNSQYSQLMQQTINVEVERIKKIFEKGKTTASDPDVHVPPLPVNTEPSTDYFRDPEAALKQYSSQPVDREVLAKSERDRITKAVEARMKQELAHEWEKLNAAKEEKELSNEDAEIKKAFSALGENLESRTVEYRDQFGILIRMEKMIRGIERIVKSGTTDNAKLSATTKLMDYQEQQMKILESLLNMEKVTQIENITRKFFLELRKHPELQVVAERYIHLLNEIE